MCGPAGAGKTTWINEQLGASNGEDRIEVISRDTIRFNLLKNNEAYFNQEEKVFEIFVEHINRAIAGGVDPIFVDATHLTENSRNKVLDRLNLNESVEIIPVIVCPSLEQCLRQNEQRTGRAHVPTKAIERMYHQFVPPTYEEKYYYTDIIEVM
jgi:predicted kinase